MTEITLKIRQTKSKTNYIPSIKLNKIKKLGEQPNRTWRYDRPSNVIILTATPEPVPTIEKQIEVKPITTPKPVPKKKKTKGKQTSRRGRRK